VVSSVVDLFVFELENVGGASDDTQITAFAALLIDGNRT
jgi:hypothetical protein